MQKSDEWTPIPYEEERELHQQYMEVKKARNKEKAEQYRKALIRLYVYYGEHFKMSGSPDYTAAKICLRKALKLEDRHPVANYRYAHLMYQDREYEVSAYHFKKALDGSPEEALSDSQALIAQMLLVSCGLQIARDALREVKFMQGNKFRAFDHERIETFNENMLVHLEQMLKEHMYCHVTPEGVRHISKDEYLEYQDRIKANEVLLYVDDTYYIKYRNHLQTLSPHAFYLLWVILRADDYIETNEIASVLGEGGAVLELRYDNIRQLLSRLSRRIPFWDEMIETKDAGNRTLRRRREGITFSLLCHSSVVLP